MQMIQLSLFEAYDTIQEMKINVENNVLAGIRTDQQEVTFLVID